VLERLGQLESHETCRVSDTTGAEG
jgi:hypothetical protein